MGNTIFPVSEMVKFWIQATESGAFAGTWGTDESGLKWDTEIMLVVFRN